MCSNSISYLYLISISNNASQNLVKFETSNDTKTILGDGGIKSRTSTWVDHLSYKPFIVVIRFILATLLHWCKFSSSYTWIHVLLLGPLKSILPHHRWWTCINSCCTTVKKELLRNWHNGQGSTKPNQRASKRPSPFKTVHKAKSSKEIIIKEI